MRRNTDFCFLKSIQISNTHVKRFRLFVPISIILSLNTDELNKCKIKRLLNMQEISQALNTEGNS